jgi:hypothetical protein
MIEQNHHGRSMLHGTGQAMTKQQVLLKINKLTLQTNEQGQYMHAILLLQKGIWCVLVSQFNPGDPGKGMEKLLDDGDNLLTLSNQLMPLQPDS